MNREDKYCIIMAGGGGSRFWPISRNTMPKQFLDILGTGRSFLQETFDRFSKIVPVENILIVTSHIYQDLVKEQLPQLLDENILLETKRKNTAPCIAYATYKLNKKNPNATVVVAPSDHLILNEEHFVDIIDNALNYASENNNLFTLGIKPTRPETGYGYIQTNKANTQDVNGYITLEVKTFTEKPNKEMAKVFIESGEFLWNSGIFIWNLATIKEELEKYLPDISFQFKEGGPFYYTDKEQEFISSVYDTCTSISIDYGVMEKTKMSWVFEATFGWSDLGTWDSFYLHSEKDSDGNMIQAAESIIENVENTIVVNKNSEKLVVVKNLKDFMVVDTDDVLMICPRDEKSIKDVITDLAANELTSYQ